MSNDFTSLSMKGLAAVDYVIVPNEEMRMLKTFSVIRACERYDKASCYNYFCINIPDHSVLKWDM